MATTILNDCSISVATVNGSGSQSANNIIMKTCFRMGLPVGAKNLFPSNIQGLPTWYTIRINKNGYTARKKELDILVALNAATWADDVKSVRSGGVIIHSDELQNSPKREDVTYYTIPFKKLAEDNFKEIKLRKLLTNMIYVGVLSELLGFDIEVLKGVVQDTFKSKQKVVESNLNAIQIGIDFVKTSLKKSDPYRLEKMPLDKTKLVIDGNTAAALGCVYGGCTFVAWYPITPSSSLCEGVEEYFQRFRVENGKNKFAMVQAEDEIAAIGMVIGAGWAGARAMTSTSGPGISLMSEFSGYAYFGEVPAVIFDVQRVGPSTGLPTRTMQGDISAVQHLSHGDTQYPMLFPANPKECFEFAQMSFDLAERLQSPIFVMSDLDLGMNFWVSEAFEMPTKPYDRGKIVSKDMLDKGFKFERYRDVDGDGIPYRTLPGVGHKQGGYFLRGSGHNEKAQYSEKGEDFVNIMNRLAKKYKTAQKYVPAPKTDLVSGAKVGILAFGSTDLAITETRDLLSQKGVKTNYLRLRALPFNDEVTEFFKNNDRVYVVEQNRDGQIDQILRLGLGELGLKSRSVRNYNGLPIDAQFIFDEISSLERANA